MKKTLLSLSLIALTILVKAQSFTATYSFSLVTMTSGVTDPSTVPLATGLTFGSFSSVGGGTVSSAQNSNAGGRFAYANWPIGSISTVDTYSTMTSTISTSRYYEVVITPNSGYNIVLDKIDFAARRSGTGIRNYAVRSSSDGFGANLLASVGTNTNLSIVGTNEFFWNFDATSTTADQNGSSVSLNTMTISAPLTIRFYGWNAEAITGNFSLDNVTITGTAVLTSTCQTSSVSLVGKTDLTCNGSVNGSATVTATNNGPFTYSWMPSGGTSDIATGLSAGLYTCAVTNSCGAVSNQTVLITQPNQIILSANFNPIVCNGGTTSVTVSATGGTTPYIYMPGSNTVTAGTYTYEVMDANNCMSSNVITVANPAVISKTQTITLCAGQTATVGTSTYSASGTYTNVLMAVNGCDSTVYSTIDVLNAIDGSVSLSGQTLTAIQTGATYQWIDCGNSNNPIANATMQSYVAGTNGSYAVIITMGNCSITSTCTAVNSVTCSVPTVSVTSVTNVTCFGLANGSATITATNNAPFTYTWMPSTNSTNIATGLSANVYTVAVTNSCGAVAQQTVMVSEPTQLVLSANYAPIVCPGGVTTVTVTATGGTPQYIFTPNTNTVTAGTYTYMVMDANNCMDTEVITVATPSNNINSTVSLNGLTITSNQAGAMYQWLDCNNGNAAIASATNQAYTASTNGSYAVMITFGGCSKTSTCTSITTVGLQNVVSTSDIKIYPNPTNGILNVSLKDADKSSTLKIVNSVGQVVFQTLVSKDNSQINIQHLTAGLYFVQLNNSKPVRLIKE